MRSVLLLSAYSLSMDKMFFLCMHFWSQIAMAEMGKKDKIWQQA